MMSPNQVRKDLVMQRVTIKRKYMGIGSREMMVEVMFLRVPKTHCLLNGIHNA